MRKLLPLILLPLALVACGQASEDAPAAAPSSTSALPATTASPATTAATLPPSSAEPGQAPTLTAVPTASTEPTATTEAPAPIVNEDTEAKVRKVLERYREKYADVFADLEASGMPMTENSIAEDIADACASGPDGIADDPNGNAFAAMILTPILTEHGFSWHGFMKDAAKANLEIQEIAGC